MIYFKEPWQHFPEGSE